MSGSPLLRSRWSALLVACGLSLAVAPAMAQGEQPPGLEQGEPPAYPSSGGGREAQVRLLVEIDREGAVTRVTIDSGAGEPFDSAAVAAARAYRFRPASRDGAPVAARIRLTIPFAPPAKAPPATPPAAHAAHEPSPPPAPPPGQAAPADASPEARAHRGDESYSAPERLESVTVLGHKKAPSRGASDYDIRVGRLADVPRPDAASLLRLAPGVFLTNEGGVGHPYQIFLRGFDAREGQDVEFTVDGVPINEVGNVHGNGLADTHFIIPELVQQLRVTEGPFAPHQGNFAVAGSAAYELGLERRGLSAKGTAGSFGTRRALLLWGPEGYSSHVFGAAETFATEGYGSNRAAQRSTAMAGYEGRIGEAGRFNLLLTSYAASYRSAGVVRVDDMKAGRVDFYGTNDPEQGGESSRHMAALRVENNLHGTSLSQLVFLSVRDFRLRENYTGYLEDPQRASQSPHPQRGDLIDQRSGTITVGGRGSARRRATVGGLPQEIELGFMARHDLVDSVQQRNRAASNIPYRRDLDLDSALTNVGLYADASLKLFSWLGLRGGVRNDFYHYRVRNRCALTAQASLGQVTPDTECFSSDRSGYRSPDQTASTAAQVFQPRATALFGPFKGVAFSLSRGLGTRSLDPQYINQGLETPFVSVTSTEGGASYTGDLLGAELTVRSVFFETSVERDLFFNQTEGRNTLASGTSRTGWAGSARVIGDFVDVAGNVTLVRATFDDTHLLIPYVPSVVVRGDGALFGELPFGAPFGTPIKGNLSAGVSYVGPRPLPFDERSEPIATVDVATTVRWRYLELGLSCTNLFDRKYRQGEYNYTSDFRSAGYHPTLVPARHYTAGEPRAIYGTLGLHFGDEGPS